MKSSIFFPIVLCYLISLVLPAALIGQSYSEKYAAEIGYDQKEMNAALAPSSVVNRSFRAYERKDAAERNYDEVTIGGIRSLAPQLPPNPASPTGSVSGDRFLPLTSTSPKAITAYHAAMELVANSDVDGYDQKMAEAIEHDPQFLMGYAFRALEHIAFDRFDEAAEFLDQAASICSEQLTPAEQIFCKLMTQWQAEPNSSPAALMDELIATYPNTFEAYDFAGRCAYWIDEDKQKAAAYFEQARALLPDYGPAYCLLGYSYLDLGQEDQAKTAFEAYLHHSPAEANAYDCLGDYCYSVKEFAQALAHYEKAVSMGMESAQARADQAREQMNQ